LFLWGGWGSLKCWGCGAWVWRQDATFCLRLTRQPEIFAKRTTDGASAARRHFLINQVLSDKAFGDEPLPLHFGFQAASGLAQRWQPENVSANNINRHAIERC